MTKKIIKAVIAEKVHSVLFDIFRSNNIECIDVHSLTEQEFFNALRNATILIVRSKKIDNRVIDNAPLLKIIGRAGSGLENIDVTYAAQKGIICLNSPEGNRDAVAEHAIGMLLMLFNNLKKADTEVRNNIWDRKSNWGIELKHQIIGIIGYGNTGSALAKKLSGFECQILVYDKYKQDIKDNFVNVVDIEKIFEFADVVSIHLPLNEETFYMVDDAFFDKFQKPIYFVNTSRGKIVRTSSLVKALKSGKVKGACLDVIEYEDTNFEQMTTSQSEDFEYLKKSDRVVLTPHIAGWTYQSYEKICRIIAEKVVEKLK